MHINWVTVREIIAREFGKRKICPVFVPRSLMDEQKDHTVTTGEYLNAEERSATHLAHRTSLQPNFLYFSKLKWL